MKTLKLPIAGQFMTPCDQWRRERPVRLVKIVLAVLSILATGIVTGIIAAIAEARFTR